MITNKTIEIIDFAKDWKGNPIEQSLGFYKVYLEENATSLNVAVWDERRRVYDQAEATKGFFILFENIDLEGKQFKYDGKLYSVRHQDKFFDEYGDFHHIEVDFR